MNKKLKGQFYTIQSNYILDGFENEIRNIQATRIIEPFAGKGDLIDWIQKFSSLPVEAYDIDPKQRYIEKRDTLKNPPNYEKAFIITNPPYLARNKSADKSYFDMYQTNDLYKCFLKSMKGCEGGILIIPAGFMLSPRDIDFQSRNDFLSQYQIKKIKYFEEDVFPDTSITVIAIMFQKLNQTIDKQDVLWQKMPDGSQKIFTITRENKWIVGGDIYHLPIYKDIQIKRYIDGQILNKDEFLTSLTLTALDSGKQLGRICLEYKEGYIYPSKDTSRSYATIYIKGMDLGIDEQKKIAEKFNNFIEKKREEYWSLFLPQYRESKEYARKRIPFELAYLIISNLILTI